MDFAGYSLRRLPVQDAAGTITYAAVRQHDRAHVLIKCLDPALPHATALNRLQNEYAITQILDAPGVVRSVQQLPHGAGFALVMAQPGTRSLENYYQQQQAQTWGDRVDHDRDTALQFFFPWRCNWRKR
jgi:hypothetical protein